MYKKEMIVFSVIKGKYRDIIILKRRKKIILWISIYRVRVKSIEINGENDGVIKRLV